MSVNWVMLSAREGFVPLPGEHILYTSPPRTTLSLQSPNTYPGQQPVSINSATGTVYLTNQRVVYLPSAQVPGFRSFSAPIMNLHDSHVSAPFFGPNFWRALVQPVPGGGLPPTQALLELKMIFKDGGAFDLQARFEQIRERLRQAIDLARESGQVVGDGSHMSGGAGAGALSGLNMAAIDLEQLPAYEEASISAIPVPALVSSIASAAPSHDRAESSNAAAATTDRSSSPAEESRVGAAAPPTEPPPDYEEVQRASVAEELERRLRPT